MEITLRKAKYDDYKGFLEVFSEIEEFHRLNAPWKFRKPESELFSKAYYQEILDNNDSIFILAEHKAEIVGYVLGTRKDANDFPILQKINYAQVNELAVKSNYRQQGIATKLMDEFEILAKEKGVSEIELNVWSFNQAAISFYEKKGYTSFRQAMRKVIDK